MMLVVSNTVSSKAIEDVKCRVASWQPARFGRKKHVTLFRTPRTSGFG
jgi:hypothetical protein